MYIVFSLWVEVVSVMLVHTSLTDMDPRTAAGDCSQPSGDCGAVNSPNSKAEVCGCAHLLQELAVKVRDQDQELSTVRKDVALLLSEIGEAKHILNGISKELTERTNNSR